MLYTNKARTEVMEWLEKAATFNNEQLENKALSMQAEFERRIAAASAEAIAREEALMVKLREEADTLFQAAMIEDRRKRYDSNEPFVEIISQTFTEENGVQLRLDWNKPFIEYLRKNGVTGPTDEAIVDNWLVSLSRERIAESGSEFK
jgi:hypothetical protein